MLSFSRIQKSIDYYRHGILKLANSPPKNIACRIVQIFIPLARLGSGKLVFRNAVLLGPWLRY